MTNKNETPNQLINETSPYLLQHAYNPVNWYPYGPEAFEKARGADKPLLISIGYSACHWCHVMAHESFEDPDLANIMNQQFIPVKVDREERPDVDQLYIDAVSLMTGRAGWPLNVFTLPDGRPIFGGTYFPKDNWREICQKITDIYHNQHQEVLDYADKLANGIQQINLIEPPTEPQPVDKETLDSAFEQMRANFDTTYGGRKTAPKFPLPDNYRFLLRFYTRTSRPEALEHVNRSLTQMARGGIYDQLGGGFSRYSTDAYWKVPHFEKMLYDNGQLLSLYAEAYQLTGNPFYLKVVEETTSFLEREMTSPETGFYSALDADTEGEEGKFYTWTESEIEEVIADPETLKLVKAHFGIAGDSLWENGKHVLNMVRSAEELAADEGKTTEQVEKQLQGAKSQLFNQRENRTRPGLDDKILLSWNALTLNGLLDAYVATGNPHYLTLASQNLQFLQSTMINGTTMYRTYKDGKAKLHGFLDDYALMIQALIAYYSATFEEDKLQQAYQLQNYVDEAFYDSATGLYQYTAKNQPALISQKFEISDNVIASPNSVTAHNLFYLAHLYGHTTYQARAHQMVQTIRDQLLKNPFFFSNWASLATHFTGPFYEVALAGPGALSKRFELASTFHPHQVTAGTLTPDTHLPLLQNRYDPNQTLIYICEDTLCKEPVTDASEAMANLKPA